MEWNESLETPSQLVVQTFDINIERILQFVSTSRSRYKYELCFRVGYDTSVEDNVRYSLLDTRR